MDLLTVSDVARIRGTSRQSALEWLRRNAAGHLTRRGRRIVISARMYARISGQRIDRVVARRLQDLEESVRELQARVDAHARALGNMHAL